MILGYESLYCFYFIKFEFDDYYIGFEKLREISLF